ncbi:MAG: hypothetical protein JWR61_1089 [Ferruginibacter sp.]|uniref:zinc-finger-containing protein n=1 Tax=Ferruginibacter sp. TaxID=1940288 RepID=UPI002658188B|nr:zinc-finger-containing protein [Ferruginibacter sp.]MDB5276134.1 hypothetical protein [Ferruginibacter sp.]
MQTDEQLHELIITGKICPYCLGKTEFVDSIKVYPRSLGMIYYCDPCAAWVSVHKGTDRAMGRLGNAKLREWKKNAHAAFDTIWKSQLDGQQSKYVLRNAAYAWLAEKLGMHISQVHIGYFDVEECKKVVEYSLERTKHIEKMPSVFPADANLKSGLAGKFKHFERVLYPPLKTKFKDGFWYDPKKMCYTFYAPLAESLELYYDFYPAKNKLHLRRQNKWLPDGWAWIVQHLLPPASP